MVHKMRHNHKNNTIAGIIEWAHANEMLLLDMT